MAYFRISASQGTAPTGITVPQSFQGVSEAYIVSKGCNTLQVTLTNLDATTSYTDIYKQNTVGGTSVYLGSIRYGTTTQNFSVTNYDIVHYINRSGLVQFNQTFTN